MEVNLFRELIGILQPRKWIEVNDFFVVIKNIFSKIVDASILTNDNVARILTEMINVGFIEVSKMDSAKVRIHLHWYDA